MVSVPDGFTVNAYGIVAVTDAASVTWTRNTAVPSVVGVPTMTPVSGFNDRPAGSDPEVTDQLYGIVPPVALISCEYATPTSPAGNEGVVIVREPLGFTFSVSGIDAVADAASVARTVKLAVPAVVGVPLITPVEAPRVRPAGSEPDVIDHE
jgi:hypothetical protein